MKNIRLYTLSMLLVMCTAIADADNYDFVEGGLYYKINNEEVSLTYGKTNYSGDIVVPQTVTHEGVTYILTEIGGDAFRDCSGVTSVTIPYGITKIGAFAFYNCTGITEFTIPSTIAYIGGGAFGKCNKLTDITCFVEKPLSINSNTFEVYSTLHVLATSLEAYKNSENWKKFNIIGDLDVSMEGNMCADPDIAYSNGSISMTCDTEGAVIHYSYSISENGSGTGNTNVHPQITITAYATMAGKRPSASVTKTFPVIGAGTALPGDVNNDGKVSIADANAVVNKFLGR